MATPISKEQLEAWKKAARANKNFHWSSRVLGLIDELERTYSKAYVTEVQLRGLAEVPQSFARIVDR